MPVAQLLRMGTIQKVSKIFEALSAQNGRIKNDGFNTCLHLHTGIGKCVFVFLFFIIKCLI